MDDLISREQTHELLSERMRDTALYNACEDAGTILIDIVQNRLERWLNELPSAEPVQKTGKWKKHILKDANVLWGYDCSSCGEWFVIGQDYIKRYKHCPNCGARMENES